MTRWLLSSAVAATLVGGAFADDTKPNPFRKPPAEVPVAPEKKNEGDPKAEKKADKATARVAHIKFAGDLEEGPTPAEALFGPPEENFAMKLARIHKAAKDDAVKGLYLELGDFACGWGKLHELKTAVRDFKKTGKKVFAYAEEYSAKAYLLACEADVISTPESGGVVVAGMRAEVTFYKNTLELLKLKVDVAKVGNYKSAVEPFLRDSMSKENREQIQSMLDDNFVNELCKPIAEGRKGKNWTAEQVEGLIDQGPFTAKKAQKLGLVDSLAYQDEFEASFAAAVGAKDAKIEKNYGKPKAAKMDLSNPFAMMEALTGGGKKDKESDADKIAVIYAVGSIVSGKGGGGNPLMGGGEEVGSDTIVEAVRKAEKDPTVKAIVLRVDSPGGSALASDVMWRELTKCKKPVVASMGDVAASGGYYISMAAKKIYAEPGTVTGSIGVFGMKIVTGGLQEWGGMKTEVVQRGKNAGVMSSTFPWTDSEKVAMDEMVDDVYEMFTSKAVAGRKAAGKEMTLEQLKALAGGRVWTGRQAKANGLIDELGTLDDAIAGAKTMAGIDPKKEMEILTLPKQVSFIDKLMDGDAKMPFGLKSDLAALPGVARALKVAAPLLATQKDPIKVLLPFHVEFK